jgi:serine/threonine protein kinase
MMSQRENYGLASPGATSPETDLAFQRYRILASLGRGGMSEVFLAGLEQDGAIQRLAVLKRLSAELCGDPATVQMFLDEARIGLRLTHPNIAQTHDVGQFEGRLCILMGYLKGQPLHRIVQRVSETGKVLPLALAVKIVVDALDGLSAAHQACDFDGTPLGVVHRDVSPHNLFIEYDGRVKVLDFGVAKAVIQEGVTRTGLVKGKFAYMAPEQARSEHVDERADIWSIGVVFWELVTGARLFKGTSEAAMLQATLCSPIPYPAAYRSDVPPALEQVVQRALERDPSRRYGSALEMKEELERWLEAQGRGLTALLATYVSQAFAAERDEQQSFLKEALAQRAAMPTSSRTMLRLAQPTLDARTQLATLAQQVETKNAQSELLMAALQRKNRLAIWFLLGLGALLAGILTGVVLVVLRALAAPEPVAGAAKAPAPIEVTDANTGPAPAPRELATPTSLLDVPVLRAAVPSAQGPGSALADLKAERLARTRRVPNAGSASARLTDGAPAGTAKPAEPGFLTLDTTPWSVVSVGPRVLGSTPLIRVALPPGDVVLSLSNPDTGAHAIYTVHIEQGQAVSRRLGLE